jgi:hypothetical protein
MEGDDIRMCNLYCYLLTADGCPGGYRCDFYESDRLDDFYSDCFPLISLGQSGDECFYYWHDDLGSRDCDVGLSCYYSYDFEQGFCADYCPSENLGDLSSYCPDERPCCIEPVKATANGEHFYSCAEEHYCSL